MRHVRLGVGEPGRHDADDGVLDAIQPDAARARVLAATEVALPEVVTDRGHRRPCASAAAIVRPRTGPTPSVANRSGVTRETLTRSAKLSPPPAAAGVSAQVAGRDRLEGPLALAGPAHLGARQHASVVDESRPSCCATRRACPPRDTAAAAA